MDEMGLANGILCDKNVPPRLKNKFYRVVVTPTIVWGILLAIKELLRSENESDGNKDADGCAYQERQY